MTKRTKEEIDAWLNDLYLECIQKGIPHEQREWIVRSKINDFIKAWSRDPIPEEEYAIQWMADRCKQGANLLPMPIFAFYFDTVFWEVKIFKSYGKPSMNALDSLTDMPTVHKCTINNDEKSYSKYEAFWANSIDLIQGVGDIRALADHLLHSNLITKNLFFAGIENLNTATAALLHPTPNSQSIMSIRMALEMFIKSYVLLHENSTSTQAELNKRAQKLNHNLKDGLDAINEIRPNIINSKDYNILEIFPKHIW